MTLTKSLSKKETPKERYARIIDAVNLVLDEYSGRMSLRQIYYRLVSKLVIENNVKSYKNLSRWLVKAREEGSVNWRRIEDRKRGTKGSDWSRTDAPDPHETIRNRLLEAIRAGRVNLMAWRGQAKRVEVWIEKDALSEIAYSVARNYNVTVCPSQGYSSFTYVKEAVGRINSYDEPVTILYFGDYDPSGMDITRDLEERLRKYGAWNLAEVERRCLSREQIDLHKLPPFPAKSSDVRFAKFVADTGSSDAVELDALEPPILKEYIKEAIESHLDIDLWNEKVQESRNLSAELNEEIDTLREAVLEAFPHMKLEDDLI